MKLNIYTVLVVSALAYFTLVVAVVEKMSTDTTIDWTTLQYSGFVGF